MFQNLRPDNVYNEILLKRSLKETEGSIMFSAWNFGDSFA